MVSALGNSTLVQKYALMKLSVIIPTHCPHKSRLKRTLEGLEKQTLDPQLWEVILVDNASKPPLNPSIYQISSLIHLRCIQEDRIGLSWARRRGILEARGNFVVLVDDDNILEASYLHHVLRLFETHPQIGALGGKNLPEFEVTPTDWQKEFLPLLALRDEGNFPIASEGLKNPGSHLNHYPVKAAPIGAGMAIRRAGALQWLENSDLSVLIDRCGTSLSSGGDNDIVLSIMKQGWEVGYFPELVLTHLIPAERLQPDYLARLNRGIQQSWMQVLTRHGANVWPPIPAWTVPLRQAKAWFTHRAWQSAAAHIRWQGACGHFEGRASNRIQADD
jgi:cellulose synthase/poly-beta-1,6-N-acetylglucosamine synthase-like glycosyltransferase